MDFENIDKRLQRKLIEITSKDPYPLQLNPKTLYRNILSSYGSDETLARIFDVPVQIVKDIKESSKWWFLFSY